MVFSWENQLPYVRFTSPQQIETSERGSSEQKGTRMLLTSNTELSQECIYKNVYVKQDVEKFAGHINGRFLGSGSAEPYTGLKTHT